MSTIIPMTNRNLYPAFVSDFDNVFNSFFGNSLFDQNFSGRRTKPLQSVPLANVSETDSGFLIDLASPGMSRDNFEISIENNTLTVSGKNNEQKQSAKYSEFSYGSFSRSWTLPKEVNLEQITANYEAGILSIAIPTENKKKHKVNINID